MVHKPHSNLLKTDKNDKNLLWGPKVVNLVLKWLWKVCQSYPKSSCGKWSDLAHGLQPDILGLCLASLWLNLRNKGHQTNFHGSVFANGLPKLEMDHKTALEYLIICWFNTIIPNDTQMFTQAPIQNIEEQVVNSDSESLTYQMPLKGNVASSVLFVFPLYGLYMSIMTIWNIMNQIINQISYQITLSNTKSSSDFSSCKSNSESQNQKQNILVYLCECDSAKPIQDWLMIILPHWPYHSPFSPFKWPPHPF